MCECVLAFVHASFGVFVCHTDYPCMPTYTFDTATVDCRPFAFLLWVVKNQGLGGLI